ncbi:MAG: hypothetical protein AAFP18_06665 [Bacteroidota bacterium]
MRVWLSCFLLVLAVNVQAQPVPGASATVKRVYNLVTPTEDGDTPVGALRRTEYETYGPDGRRLRVEWRAPDGSVSLAFMELYDASDQPFGAVYFEGADLDPTLERFEYRPEEGGRVVRTVTYLNGAGEVTGVNEFVSDADGREVERRYGVSAEGARGTDTVTYDGANATGYVYESTDGSRRIENVFRIETLDERGNWTSRTVVRNGAPQIFETREITYRAP